MILCRIWMLWEKEQRRQVTLYLSNRTGDKLRAVTTSVTYNAATPLAELLINQLIQADEVIAGQKREIKGCQTGNSKGNGSESHNNTRPDLLCGFGKRI